MCCAGSTRWTSPWIEEPLDPRRAPANGPHDLFARLAQLQRRIQTPVCLDESIFSANRSGEGAQAPGAEVLRAQDREIRRHTACAAVRAHGECARHERVDGRHVRHRHLAACACGVPDAARRDRRWATSAPPRATSTSTSPIRPTRWSAEMVTLERRGHEHGLGCTLDRPALSRVLIDQQTYE